MIDAFVRDPDNNRSDPFHQSTQRNRRPTTNRTERLRRTITIELALQPNMCEKDYHLTYVGAIIPKSNYYVFGLAWCHTRSCYSYKLRMSIGSLSNRNYLELVVYLPRCWSTPCCWCVLQFIAVARKQRWLYMGKVSKSLDWLAECLVYCVSCEEAYCKPNNKHLGFVNFGCWFVKD